MIILIKLILAHLLGDFLFQPYSWVQEKEIKKHASIKLYFHVLIHGLLILVFLWDLELWPVAALIVIAHFIIDLCKLNFQTPQNKTRWFITDQVLHLISILIVWYIWLPINVDLGILLQSPILWLYITALIFLSVASGIIIQELLSYWSNNLLDNQDSSLSNAGKYIGILERLFVFVFVVTANWEAVGFLLAAKSVFRFGDLKESKDRKLTEYILIGTLLSFGIAIFTGLVVLKVDSLLTSSL